MAFEAAAYPPFRAGFHANPPIEAFKHFESARDTEVTGGVGVARLHDPRSGQEGHVDANGVVKRRPSKAGGVAVGLGGGGGGTADEQCSIVVTLDQAAFGGEIEDVCGVGALVRGDVVAQRGRKGLRTAELDISASCVTEGVFTLCFFPIAVAVVQQGVREVYGCSLNIRVR